MFTGEVTFSEAKRSVRDRRSTNQVPLIPANHARVNCWLDLHRNELSSEETLIEGSKYTFMYFSCYMYNYNRLSFRLKPIIIDINLRKKKKKKRKKNIRYKVWFSHEEFIFT